MRGGKTVNRTPHTVSRLVLTFVAVAVTTACAVVTGGALGASRKLPATLDALCQLPGYVKGNGTVVRFRASDGTELVGATVGRGRVGVVLANSWSDGNGRICNWVAKRSKLINALVGSGYRVLLFDYRREGFSQRKATGSFEPDLVAANAELRRLGASQVVIMTEGTGALVAYSALPKIRPVPAGIISYLGQGYPGQTSTDAHRGGQVNGKAAVAAVNVPLFFILPTGGTYKPGMQALYKAARAKGKQRLVVAGDADGADFIYSNPAAATRIINGVLGFIRAHTTG